MVNYENREFKAQNCSVCGQQQHSVAKKYRDYLLKYIGNNDNNRKKFDALYRLRSKIVHTGMKFPTENLFNSESEERKKQDLINQMEVILLNKLSIAYWLVINNKDNNLL